MYGGVQGHMVDVAQVVNGGLEPVLCDDGSHRRPVFQLDLGQTQSQPLRGYSDKVKPDPKFSRQECRVLDDVIMFPITSIETQGYEGWVYDMEVEEDHSYVVEGVAVHNCSIDGSTCTKCGHWAADETEFCDHVRYEKGNSFFGEDGQKYRVAELCGDESLEPNGGVTFIEASWVEVPAFTGAVARNVISVDTESDPEQKKTAQKMKRVFESPAVKADPNAMKKAASEDRVADMFDEVPAEEGAPAEAAPPPPPAPPVSPLHGIQDELKKFILDNVQEQLKTELQKTKIDDQTLPPSDAPNDTLVKQAAAKRAAAHRLAGMGRAYTASLREILATSSTEVDLLNRVATLNREIGISVPVSLYRAMLKVGARNSYPGVNPFLRAASKALGHQPTPTEAKTMIRLASLLEAHRYFRRPADTKRS